MPQAGFTQGHFQRPEAIDQMNISPSPSAATNTSRAKFCRCCGAPLTTTLVDLGMSPLCESFRSVEQLDTVEYYYPLHVLICQECFLAQLGEYVSSESIFSEYAYFSSYSSTWIDHAKQYCEMISARLALSGKSTVVELASNDGYLLQHFLPMNISVLGIEPAANVAAVAIEKGIPCRIAFFGEALARDLTAEGIQADLIVANNVLAQVPDLNDFVSGITVLLAPQGVATLEFPHLIQLIDNNQFDTIYHEHFSYFSLAAIDALAGRCELRVIDVEELPTHGGSLRVYLSRTTASWPASDAVNRLRSREAAWGIKSMSSYAQFATNVERVKRNLLRLLIDAKDAGKTVCGYGAPGKGNTLLNYCGIGRDLIDFTVDRNPYKHGRYTPGMHIPILPVEALEVAKPDYVLVVPWNLKSEIMSQMRHVGSWGAKFIVPIPDPMIIDPRELAS